MAVSLSSLPDVATLARVARRARGAERRALADAARAVAQGSASWRLREAAVTLLGLLEEDAR
jgi:hypothetical protein